MTVNDVYERVVAVPLIKDQSGEAVTVPDRKQFFIFLNDAIADLTAMYGVNEVYWPNVPKSEEVANIRQGDAELLINPVYHAALADYICYRMGGGDVYMTEYSRKAAAAYHTLYRRRFRRARRLVREDVW